MRVKVKWKPGYGPESFGFLVNDCKQLRQPTGWFSFQHPLPLSNHFEPQLNVDSYCEQLGLLILLIFVNVNF